MKASHEKSFLVGPPVRSAIEVSQWKLNPPAAGSRAAFEIELPRPLDQALASRMIVIVTGAGEAVSGRVALTEQERKWTLLPDRPWAVGKHRVTVRTTIEDLAGNNIGKAFEVDQFERINRRITTPTVELPFEIR